MEYKLLTPGPLTTTMAVKERMLFDHCTWDDDYKQITCRICDGLLLLGHVAAPEYTAVLVQGNGTFGVESVLTSVIGADEKVLIAANGAYGLRMTDICLMRALPARCTSSRIHFSRTRRTLPNCLPRIRPSRMCPWCTARPRAVSSTILRRSARLLRLRARPLSWMPCPASAALTFRLRITALIS